MVSGQITKVTEVTDATTGLVTPTYSKVVSPSIGDHVKALVYPDYAAFGSTKYICLGIFGLIEYVVVSKVLQNNWWGKPQYGLTN